MARAYLDPRIVHILEAYAHDLYMDILARADDVGEDTGGDAWCVTMAPTYDDGIRDLNAKFQRLWRLDAAVRGAE